MKDQNGTILVEVALLTIIVLLVDETLVRAGMAFVPAMLLAQRALSAAGRSSTGPPGRPHRGLLSRIHGAGVAPELLFRRGVRISAS